MAWLAEILLFLLPFFAFWLWRRLNPQIEPGPIVPVLLAVGAVCALAGGLWYGLSRSMQGGTVYVPPHLEDGRIVPGHAEPRR